MARICGICKRNPREGEVMHPMRVVAEDFTPEALTALGMAAVPEAGLYHGCADCRRVLGPAIVARVNKTLGTDHTVETFPQNHFA